MTTHMSVHIPEGVVTLLMYGALILCAAAVGGGLCALGLLDPPAVIPLALSALIGGAAAAKRGDRTLEDAVLELVSPEKGGGGT